MRKILLGTSALIGATAIVAGASAAAPELTISGNYDFHIVGGEEQATSDPSSAGDNPDSAKDVGKGGRDNGYRFNSADSISEIRFRAHGDADSGVKYGAVIDYRYLASSTDEAYLYVEGNFGRFHLGQDDGAVDHRMVGADSIAPGGYLINGWDVFLAPEANGTSDENKVVYFTPHRNGFDAAISLTDGNGVFEDVVEVGVSYHNDLFGVDYTVSAGYFSGSVASKGDDVTGDNEVTLMSGMTEINPDDLAEWNVGAKLGYGPVSFAFAYGDEGDSGVYAITSMQYTAATAGDVQDAFEGKKTEGRKHYNIGLAYDLGGGMNIGISYGSATKSTWQASENKAASFSAEHTQNLLALDIGLPLMEGMAGYAGVAFSEYERDGLVGVGAAAIPTINREATTFVIGTTVSF